MSLLPGSADRQDQYRRVAGSRQLNQRVRAAIQRRAIAPSRWLMLPRSAPATARAAARRPVPCRCRQDVPDRRHGTKDQREKPRKAAGKGKRGKQPEARRLRSIAGMQEYQAMPMPRKMPDRKRKWLSRSAGHGSLTCRNSGPETTPSAPASTGIAASMPTTHCSARRSIDPLRQCRSPRRDRR